MYILTHKSLKYATFKKYKKKSGIDNLYHTQQYYYLSTISKATEADFSSPKILNWMIAERL